MSTIFVALGLLILTGTDVTWLELDSSHPDQAAARDATGKYR